ncbi:MAG TPA: molecular chaperone [Arsenophonus nasoniae]|uniref:fimbrial biogenesis chaperone n=1 Tax=Arsenophonus nasoniae TaxID=638 RepID=UPI0038794BC5
MSNILISFIAIITLFFTSLMPYGYASVVMTGTRIIYYEGMKDKTIQLSNNDIHPNIIQVWLENSDKNSTTEMTETPFIVNPQIFRIEAKSGQIIRLMWVDDNLPKDRESLFYFNFSQVPAFNEQQHQANKLVLLFNTRIIIFYRPKNLLGDINQLADKLIFRQNNEQIIVENPTGYYSVVHSATLISNSQSFKLADSIMLSPKTTTQ